MSSFNKVLLMGNLTRDPELRYTPNGSAVVKIGIAVNRKFHNRNTNELEEETTFVDIEGWGKQAETFNQYMKKGRPVFIEGRLRLDRWQDQNGNNRSKLLVVMENFRFIGGREGGTGAGSSRGGRSMSEGGGSQAPVQAGRVSERPSSPPPPAGGEAYDFDDIPF